MKGAVIATEESRLVGWLDERREAAACRLRRLWSLWPLVALLASLVLAVLVTWVRELTPLDATELSLIFGFGAGFAVSVQRSAVERRAHTIELLTQLSTSQVLAPAAAWMAERVAEGELPAIGDLDDQELAHLVTLLNYSEVLCIMASKEVLDRKVLLAMRGPAMANTFDLTRGYVMARRVSNQHDELYENLERMRDTVRVRAEVRR